MLAIAIDTPLPLAEECARCQVSARLLHPPEKGESDQLANWLRADGELAATWGLAHGLILVVAGGRAALADS